MFGKNFVNIGFRLGASIIKQNKFVYSNAAYHMQTKLNYLKTVPVGNMLMIENLREIMGKRQVTDIQLTDLTSMSQVISLILRGTITAKCSHHQIHSV